MSNKEELQALFNGDFAVHISFDEELGVEVANLLKVARDLGVEFNVDEGFANTWMESYGCDYDANNWGYLGVSDGETYVADGRWGKVLSVEEFRQMVTGVKTHKVGDNLVLNDGVIVINYKNGQKYHLHHEGVATFNPSERTVTTEHTFLKDGQKAYERVVINLDSLESVQSKTNKLINVGNNQVAFVTLYDL